MQQKISMDLLQTAIFSAGATVSGASTLAAAGIPTKEQEQAQNPEISETPQIIPPISPYYDELIRSGSFGTWIMPREFKQHLRHVVWLFSRPEFAEKAEGMKALQLLDIDRWLGILKRKDADFAGYKKIEAISLPENLRIQMAKLYESYAERLRQADRIDSKVVVTTKDWICSENTDQASDIGTTDFRNTESIELLEYLAANRFYSLFYQVWEAVLSLNIDHENEFEYWTERLGFACCPIGLENVSITIRLVAGQWVEDRDLFLAKLRPYFTRNVERLQAKEITCDCAEGLV